MLIREIPALETYELRHSVLRPGFPRSSVHYEQDLWEGTFHLGVELEDKIISVGSFYKMPKMDPYILSIIDPSHLNKDPQYQDTIYQLRGMATLLGYRNIGAGGLLLNTAKKILMARGATLIWCNARKAAFPFYQRMGFKEVGNFFNTYTVPHKVMYKRFR